MMRFSLVLFLVLMPAAALTGQDGDGWLPPAVENGAAQQLAARMEEAGLEPSGDGGLLPGARRFVAIVRGVLESWGEDGVLEHAPEFPELEVARTGRIRLDAMGRYQVCNLILMRQLQDPVFADDSNAKMTSVSGLTSVTLAIVYLRYPFLASGGTEAEIEAHLTDPWIDAILQKVQTDVGAREHAASQCMPTLIALMNAPAE